MDFNEFNNKYLNELLDELFNKKSNIFSEQAS